jgi:hypothetical protein
LQPGTDEVVVASPSILLARPTRQSFARRRSSMLNRGSPRDLLLKRSIPSHSR